METPTTPVFGMKTAYRTAYETAACMLTPKQISETLTIPPSTLRRWAQRFEEFLSTETQPGKHRTYTPTDLNTFRTIQELLANGKTYAQIENELATAKPEPAPSMALAALPEFQAAIEEFRANNAAINEMLFSELEEFHKWRNEFNAWASLPWWKRIFTPPPNAPQRPQND
jgi:DNA-binding transcriptional MerR regulator